MNKLIISSFALACAAQAFAYVEKAEIMTVEKADGSTIEYNVADLDRVSFGIVETEYNLYLAPATGNALKLTSVPTMFRAAPAKEGDPYEFGFSAVEAAEPADARQGEYAVQLSVSPLKMNSQVDLAGGVASGVTVAIYHYTDGEVDNVWEAQTEGSLSMTTNAKTGVVTINLEAVYADGTELYLTHSGKPTAADDMVGLNPPFEYKNQGEYFNKDGNSYGPFSIERASHKTTTSRGVTYEFFEFDLSNGMSLQVYVVPSLVNTMINFEDAEADQFRINYGSSIQVASRGSEFIDQAMVGTLYVQQDEDGKYKIDLDMLNRYISMWGGAVQGSEKERVVFNYNEATFE